MDNPRLPRMLYVFLVMVCLLMMAYYYPLMPERMAAHFAADGRPNGWVPREAFFLIMLVVSTSSAVVTFFAPWQITWKGKGQINLPNREYWLAPERRSATLQYIAATFGWFGCGLLFVLICGTYLALRANLTAGGRFNSEAMLGVLAGFFLFLIGWVLGFLRHFRKAACSRGQGVR